MIDPDTLHWRLEAAVERGEMTEQEAREEWLDAKELAEERYREWWEE